MCVSFNTVGEIAGLGRIGGEKWRRRGDGAGRAWGVDGAGMGNGWRGRVTEFSGVRGSDRGMGGRPTLLRVLPARGLRGSEVWRRYRALGTEREHATVVPKADERQQRENRRLD